MTNRFTLCASLVFFAGGSTLACGGDSNGGSQHGSQGGGAAHGGSSALSGAGGVASGGAVMGGTAGSSRGGSAGQAPTREPLLNRPLGEFYDCKMASPVLIATAPKAEGAVLGPEVASGSLIAFTKDFSVALAERGLFTAVLDESGTVTSPVRVSEELSARAPALVAQGEHTTLLWIQSSSTGDGADAVWTAQLDASGAIVRPGKSSMQPSGGMYVNDIRVATSAGEARAFVTILQPMTGYAKIVSAALASDGSLASPLATVVENDGPLTLFDVTAFAGGYALGYGYYDGSDTVARYVALDEMLNQRHPPVAVAMGWFGIWGGQMDLLARGDRMLMAKTATQKSDDGLLATVIELAVYDSDGNMVGENERLQAPVFDEENVSPRLVPRGEDLGLLWSKGSVIYVCAGCTPDNALEYVVLDGTSLRPKSSVVEFSSPDGAGGLVEGDLVGDGQNSLLLTNVQYHVTSTMASGRLACSTK